MKKVIFDGPQEKFESTDFKKLMKKMEAEKLGEIHTPLNNFGRGKAEYSISYYFNKENIVAQYYWTSDSNFTSKVNLKGNLKDMEGIEKKILEAINSTKFDAEGFRIY